MGHFAHSIIYHRKNNTTGMFAGGEFFNGDVRALFINEKQEVDVILYNTALGRSRARSIYRWYRQRGLRESLVG